MFCFGAEKTKDENRILKKKQNRIQNDPNLLQADSFVVKYMHEPGNRMDTEKWKQLPVVSIDKENPKRFAIVSELNAHKPYAFCVLAVKNNVSASLREEKKKKGSMFTR